MEKFIFNPELPFIRKDYPGNLLVDERFVNEDRKFGASFARLLQWILTANPQREEKRNDNHRLVPQPDPAIFNDGPDAFTWLGHAAFLFRINNKRILTDPCLYDLPRIKRQFPSPFSVHTLKPIDYILLSHSHRDHFDIRSMRGIIQENPEVKIYCSLRMNALVRAVGGKNIAEAGWYQEFPSDQTGIRFVFLPAKHWNRRYLHDTNRELWGAFWIGSEKQSFYFAGDTAYYSHFGDAKKNLPPLHHAFLPIGAYKPHFMMKDSHTSPEEAIQAFHDLGARYFVPMHYGTYDLSNEPMSEPMKIVNEKLESRFTIASEIIPGKIYPLNG